jgi:hypothetical protein
MDIYFYRIAGFSKPNLWFCNWNGVAINEWCHNNGVKYKIEYFDGFKTGIILLEDKDKVYFQLRWGNTPRTFEDYID